MCVKAVLTYALMLTDLMPLCIKLGDAAKSVLSFVTIMRKESKPPGSMSPRSLFVTYTHLF